MLVKSKVVNKVFAPIEVTVVFETQEEVCLFRELMSHNVTVPSRLLEMGHISKAQELPLTEMMSKINGITLIR